MIIVIVFCVVRHSKKASVSNQRQNNLKNIGESKKPRFGYGTNNAVEKVTT